MNSIIRNTQQTLHELNQVMHQLSDAQFSQCLPIFSGSSIGMHARHIIEFYQCLLQDKGVVEGINYDKRNRDMLLQTNRAYFNTVVDLVLDKLEKTQQDRLNTPLSIFSENESDMPIPSSFGRELQYNLEHTVHHAAFIKIGILSQIPDADIPPTFGVAASTTRYNAQKIQLV
jgi:hypothetical protein